MINPQTKTLLIFSFLGLLFLGIGYIIAGFYGLIIGLIIALILNLISYYNSKDIVLSSYPLEKIKDKEIIEIFERITKKAKMPMPEIYYALVNYPNAFATGRDPNNSAVVLTKPLVNLLDKKELEAVIAHELGHIYNRDVLIQTVAAVLGSALTFFVEFALWFGNDEDTSWWQILLIYLAVIILVPIIQLAISREREYLADEFSAKITKDPDSLISALIKIEEFYKQESKHLFIKPSHQHLMIFSPSELFSTHPPIEKRIKRLKELKKKINKSL
ncbi:MAG TPA: protease HtpX [Nautiliaceae bacterium]|nr:protease HtpX [Nautiliaceae bacterium]